MPINPNEELTPETSQEAFTARTYDPMQPVPEEAETNMEAYIKYLYDKTQRLPEKPDTREEYFMMIAGQNIDPGSDVEPLTVTANGTYSEAGKAYSPVTVNVPLPTNANERKSVTSYPVTDSANYPLPKCDVTVTDADKCEVIITTDNTITEDSGVYLNRQSGGGNRELDAIVGGSIVWNQLVKDTDTSCTVQSGHKYVLKQGSTYTVVISDGTAFTVDGSVNDNVHDLTATFGSTIADYVYTLEQATAGSGIAWLKSYGYLTEDYYGYTANKIESVSVARHVMKDSNDSVIGSYAINPITLRGIPKLNASNQLYYDGDRYEASGRVTRKYGVVDLGTLSWSVYDTNKFYTTISNMKMPVETSDRNKGMICERYTPSTNLSLSDIDDKAYLKFNQSENFWVKDSSYSDATTFKTALSGIMLIYEKATPTTENTSPFEPNQIVDANGTEEYIDAGVEAGSRDVAIPVGHDTKYLNGKAYVKPLTAGTSDTISMADMGIMPTSPMYISANGSVDVEYWKSNS